MANCFTKSVHEQSVHGDSSRWNVRGPPWQLQNCIRDPVEGVLADVKTHVEAFLRACEPCARYFRGNVRHQAYLQTPLIGEPWQRVSVDITGPHPRSLNSKQYILTLVDHFSKWAEAIPLSNYTASTVAKALLSHVFSRFGMPRQQLTDRGPEFESALFTELMECRAYGNR